MIITGTLVSLNSGSEWGERELAKHTDLGIKQEEEHMPSLIPTNYELCGLMGILEIFPNLSCSDNKMGMIERIQGTFSLQASFHFPLLLRLVITFA